MPDLSHHDIVIVDDDHLMLNAYRRLLQGAGFRVVGFSAPAPFLNYLSEHHPRLVLLDVSMPGTSGIEVLQLVHKIDPDLPVILFTGSPDVHTAAKALQYGAIRYLRKGEDDAELLHHVREGLDVGRLAKIRRQALHHASPVASQFADVASMESAFDEALTQLWIAYQPIVSLEPKKIIGYEALVRTRSQLIPNPGVLFDAAEQLDRVEELGELIRSLISTVFQDLPRDVSMFVNLHPLDLKNPGLYITTTEFAHQSHRIVLEITERASLHSIPDARRRIKELRDNGFRIAIDDLGAGYAGLSSFVDLAPNVAKIDMSLVRDVHGDAIKQRVIQSIVTLSHEMGTLVVAEGVESEQESVALQTLACDALQGYYFARPGPAFPSIKGF